ncbi:immunoglobulin-like and fibronectin type III domain-containing protein 1 [Denticeps clupeoides]|uniref:immunoglobulin-like and fibronectin type III domain-containing protein 1 n=1 Tax=Denticeps clupeoides TaxID=299321 RepID=UPI0010A53880|nr:immunoglobulin-like and fibronectin type III domain-containing protein 1 [Denticeps clupeoides]
MITQYVEEVPADKSHPDFTRKPIALTIQEGKLAIFKAIVIGDPEPVVSWARSNGDVSDPAKYQMKFDPVSRENTLEMANVSPDQADTYKCYAKNEFGKAVVTVMLNVIEVGYKKKKVDPKTNASTGPSDFKSMLKRKSKVKAKSEGRREGEIDPKFWELLLSADKKDYERICAEYGVTDFRWMLKKLNEMKKEREEEQAQFIKNLTNLKPIEVKGEGYAQFEIDMDLLDASSRIFIYKDGEMVPYSKEVEMEMKHSLKQVGKKYVFTIRDLLPDDAGLYQLDVEDVNIFSTDFKIPMVDFLVKIQEVKAMEREDAVFECVLSNPFSHINWFGKSAALEAGEKYDITVSEDKLIHRLVVKDCMPVDKGIYAAVAGIKSCNAWLVVESDDDPNSRGKKKARKTTQAGGSGVDLEKIAKEQQDKLQKEREKIEVLRAAKAEIGSGTRPDVTSGSGGNVSGGADLGAPLDSGANVGGDAAAAAGGKLHFTSGLSDTYAIRGKPAEMSCKLSSDSTQGVWSKDGEQLSTTTGPKISKSGGVHKLKFQSASDTDSGLYAFEVEGLRSQASMIVGDVPELDPDELHRFSKPVIVKAGQNASFKMTFAPQDSLEIRWFKDGVGLQEGGGVKIQKEPSHSRLLMKECLRSDSGEIKILLKNPFGSVEAMSRLIVLDKPGPPEGPVDVIDSSSSVIQLKWKPPLDDGGSGVTNYIIERQQVGETMWKKLGDVSADRMIFRDRNVSHGRKYVYRIYAENPEGIGEPLVTEGIMAGELVFPGPPSAPKVISASKSCIALEWAPPETDGGFKILGYQLEKRKKDTNQWVSLNPANEPIEGLKFAVKDVSEGSEYEFRVSAINMSGVGEPSPPSPLVCAKNPKMKPQFKDAEDFMVVRAGNSVRIKICYEAEPVPDITWLKNNEPISPWINIINVEGMSQLVIPSSKRSDSAIYTIIAKNSSGTSTFEVEVRVTDEPKAPGPVQLEQVVDGKVIITWAPSPDQELDDRVHYMVAEHESNSRIWRTIADRLFCNTFTANVHPGREYHFRVYAKNDMGLSEPSDSPTWGININRATLVPSAPVFFTLERPPSILVPLKVHTPPKGYQCYMTCAIRGCPAPHVSWYLDGICISGDKHYYITNAHGVCSMYILRVSSSDSGEYKVVAVNSHGKAECSTKLRVKE